MQNKEILLSVRNLTARYTSEGKIIHAVNGVSFDVERRRTLGLVGETGAGKTTIAKSILKILPDPPGEITGGSIRFEGQNLMELGNDEMRKIRGHKISMIFQDPMTALNPVMRVGSQIAEVIRLHRRVSKRKSKIMAAEILKKVGIAEDRFREYPHQFSGGMKQRVVIAIALACNPDLILADEPTTALDVTIQAQVLEMVNSLKEEKDMSMILISHDLGVVAESCDDVAVIYAGEIVEYGTKEDLFDHPSHPYTIGLFNALPNMNADADRLIPIKGLPPDPSKLPGGCNFHPRCPFAGEECGKGKIDLVPLTGCHQCRCIRLDEIRKKENLLCLR